MWPKLRLRDRAKSPAVFMICSSSTPQREWQGGVAVLADPDAPSRALAQGRGVLHLLAVRGPESGMDEAQRVPIDLSTPSASDEAPAGGRLSQRADGSWVIDI